MNRFLPWIGGAIGVAIVATGGYFAYSSFSSRSAQENNQNQEFQQPEEKKFVLCNGSEDVVFEDFALFFAIAESLNISSSTEGFSYKIACDKLLALEELNASDRTISNLKGIENAINLKRLDLNHNPLESIAPLFSLEKLELVNLADTNRDTFSSVSKQSLKSLDLAKNSLFQIDQLQLNEYSKLSSINLHTNKISNIRSLLLLNQFQNSAAYVSLYNNPLDLSPNKENRQIIQQLIDKGIDVVWDELALNLRVGDGARSKEVEVSAPTIVSLTASVQKNSVVSEDIHIESVEFFEVTPQGSLSSINMDSEPPFSFGVGFDVGDQGTFQYAAEVRTKNGATFLTPPSEYVTIRVKKSECLKNADCDDKNQCTTNACVNNVCSYKPIAACGQCRADADCKDDLQCTTDRCISGKCEHYMQTACSEDDEISCTDKIDNNKNGKVDCADPDCAQSALCKETICYDGTDNDKDGKIDCRDSDCSVEPTCGEICDNGINDDADLNVDCNDRRDCADHPSCKNNNVQSCNSDVKLYCYDVGESVYCSLDMNIKGSNQCSASVVTCDRSRCWNPLNSQPFDFQGCGTLQNKLQTLPAGTVLSGNAALGLDSSQMCGGLNLCRRIILCE